MAVMTPSTLTSAVARGRCAVGFCWPPGPAMTGMARITSSAAASREHAVILRTISTSRSPIHTAGAGGEFHEKIGGRRRMIPQNLSAVATARVPSFSSRALGPDAEPVDLRLHPVVRGRLPDGAPSYQGRKTVSRSLTLYIPHAPRASRGCMAENLRLRGDRVPKPARRRRGRQRQARTRANVNGQAHRAQSFNESPAEVERGRHGARIAHRADLIRCAETQRPGKHAAVVLAKSCR